MALINRVARLFRADMHAVLDRIEEPQSLLRQAVREMEEAVVRERRRADALDRERVQLASRTGGLEHALEELEGELDLCFSAGREELARGLVKRKLESQRLLRVLGDRRESLERELGQLHTRLEENCGRLEAMRQKAELLAGERAEEPSEGAWSDAPELAVRDQEVEVALLREQQKRRVPA